jgi:23S rRNA (cytidine1920-2'-O)/16S rRNA (cytidine1409-2'-O)-methyltransferase
LRERCSPAQIALRQILLKLVGEQVEQQAVLPFAVRCAPVATQDADSFETGGFVGSYGLFVPKRGVDGEAMVTALIDEPARKRTDSIAAEAAAVDVGREEEVDVRVLELVLSRLRELREADQLALELDRERRGVISPLRLRGEIFRRHLAPPARDLGFGADLDEPGEVAVQQGPQSHAVAVQLRFRHGGDHTSVKKRIDILLVERGLAETRAQAQALVIAGRVPGHEKPGEQVDEAVPLEVTESEPYVSRGGVKLANALAALRVEPAGLDALDVGASTGGFTDVLLQRGAARVIALDVGYGQLHPRIRADPRVTVLERTNAREVTELPFAPQLVVCDVAFISVRTALPPLLVLAAPAWQALVLVKPQFEAGRADVRRGVVRDGEVHRRVLRQVAEAAVGWGGETVGVVDSGLPGPKGNREFFLHLVQRKDPQLPPDLDERIGAAIG